MGIAASVHIRWLFYFVIAMLLVVFFLKVTSLISRKKFNKEFFNVSFSEGNSMSILELETSGDISIVDSSKFLVSKTKKKDKIYYTLASPNFNELNLLLQNVKNENDLENYQIKLP